MALNNLTPFNPENQKEKRRPSGFLTKWRKRGGYEELAQAEKLLEQIQAAPIPVEKKRHIVMRVYDAMIRHSRRLAQTAFYTSLSFLHSQQIMLVSLKK